jgi:hypothetical protein
MKWKLFAIWFVK